MDKIKKATNVLDYDLSDAFFCDEKRVRKKFSVAVFESVFLFPILIRNLFTFLIFD